MPPAQHPRPDARPPRPERQGPPRRRARSGAAAVEFALTLPVVIVVATAILDYSWFLNRSADVLTAVREGTRHGTTIDQADDPAAEAATRTETALSDYGFTCSGSCSINAVVGDLDGMSTITVQATVPYEPIVGLVPTPENMGATLVMALEDQSAD